MRPFVKPFIPFETFPSDYAKVWLKSDYQKCQTKQQCMDFAFACLHRAEDTNNPVKERDCYSVFNFLYQKITGESYQYTLLNNKQLTLIHMALFETEHFGKPISAELSKYLLTYTDKFDRAQAARVTDIGLSTIRDVAYRSSSLTQKNSEGIVALMRIAVHNCTHRIRHAKKTKQQLNTMLENG